MEDVEFLQKVIRSQEKAIMNLVRERDTPAMSKNECKRLMNRFDALVKERNQLDEQLQNAQNTIFYLRLRNSTLEEVCRNFNIGYQQVSLDNKL